MKPITARTLFGVAVTLYFLWVAALACMVVVSASRPADGKRPSATARASAPAGPEQAKD